METPLPPEKSIVALNLDGRLAVCRDNQVCSIVSMIAADGEETEDPDEVVFVVIKIAEGAFTNAFVEDFSDRPS